MGEDVSEWVEESDSDSEDASTDSEAEWHEVKHDGDYWNTE